MLPAPRQSLREQPLRNTGLAMAIALSFFDKEKASRAAGVPLYYAVVQVTLAFKPVAFHGALKTDKDLLKRA